MTSKGAKETIVSKLGFKSNSSSSKVEAELERVRKENSHLRKKMDELAKRQVKPPDSDKSKLLERILSLETMRERNNQQLQIKEQELATTRQQLSAKGGEVVASLQAQLEQRRQEAEQRDRLFQTLSEETGNLRNKLAAVSARCQVLETPETQNGQMPSGELAIIQDQLRDALEKNQQWMVYDQQREAYVQSVVTRTMELEQQLAQAKQNPQSTSDESSAPPLQGHYEQLLQGTQKDLETQRDQAAKAQQELQAQREQTSRAQAEVQSLREQVSRCQEEMSSFQRSYEDSSRELSSFQRKYEEKSSELDQTKEQLKAERRVNRHAVSDERQVSSERTDRMRVELESMEVRLEEERKRSAELQMQVNMLQTSHLNQNEEHRRISALEQQIQLSAKDFEDEKMDRQSLQHQLQKMLKELRKARDQITRLESAKQPSTRFSEPSSYNRLDFERLTIADSTSPSRLNLLDESFLECPKCRASYPTSQHRELLNHMDYCMA